MCIRRHLNFDFDRKCLDNLVRKKHVYQGPRSYGCCAPLEIVGRKQIVLDELVEVVVIYYSPRGSVCLEPTEMAI
jgi:hypothetical protein